jgi:hypothetical protein
VVFVLVKNCQNVKETLNKILKKNPFLEEKNPQYFDKNHQIWILILI